MKISTNISFVGFLLVLSTLNPSNAEAKIEQTQVNSNSLTIESRLDKLTAIIQEREKQLPESSVKLSQENETEIAWGNWRNGGGGFTNINRPSWRDGGGFNNWRNNNWRNGGGWLNGGGGSWINIR
jgi:rSAM-associated Gly-rich repeat protein